MFYARIYNVENWRTWLHPASTDHACLFRYLLFIVMVLLWLLSALCSLDCITVKTITTAKKNSGKFQQTNEMGRLKVAIRIQWMAIVSRMRIFPSSNTLSVVSIQLWCAKLQWKNGIFFTVLIKINVICKSFMYEQLNPRSVYQPLDFIDFCRRSKQRKRILNWFPPVWATTRTKRSTMNHLFFNISDSLPRERYTQKANLFSLCTIKRMWTQIVEREFLLSHHYVGQYASLHSFIVLYRT